MSVTVIATLHAHVDQRDTLLAELARVVPDVLAEPGCLGYAPHTVGRDRVVIVESWESMATLEVHAAAAPLAQFNAAVVDLLAAPMDVVVARPVDVSRIDASARTSRSSS